jgi:signal transduction histidine kinase
MVGAHPIGFHCGAEFIMSEAGHALVGHGRILRGLMSRDAPRGARSARMLETAALGAAYLAVYVLLDWISSVEHNPLANYSWNPNVGASIAAAVIFGPRMLPFLFLAPLLGDLVVPQFPLPLSFEIAATVLLGSIYGGAALFLLRPGGRFDCTLATLPSLIVLTFTVVVSGALAAAGYMGIAVASGMLPAAEFVPVAASYAVGDMIGIMVVVPFSLMVRAGRHGTWLSMETLLQLIAIAVALAFAYAYWKLENLPLFHILFLPIVWMAVRSGTEGVSLGILATQVFVILGFHAFPGEIPDMPKMQALMLVLAFTGLFAGGLVTERRRTEAVLRLHQESLARLARLGSAGELAAAVAHELNQPLMAAGTYTRLVDDALRTGHGNTDTVAETARKAAAQVERAAAVVRRLRALVRLDRSNRVACRVDRLVRETIDLCQPDLDRAGIRIQQSIAPGLPPVLVDVLQIEQALLNLVRNSIDAIAGAGRRGAAEGVIAIEAGLKDKGFIEICVCDSGPGFPPDRAANPFLPLISSRKEGLGIGLSLTRSLIDAHGGRIWLDAAARGAAMHFTLPVAPPAFLRLSHNDTYDD